MNQIKIGDETIVKINEGQYIITPIDEDYFIGLDDVATPYEIVIGHDGEQWTVGTRSFPTDRLEDMEYDSIESEDNPGHYLNMLPQIKKAFGDV